MKIRTQDEFFDRVDKESSWRKKELSGLLFSLQEARPLYQSILIRGAVALAYAHWEGFIKKSSEYYLIYLSSKRIVGNTVSSNLRDCYISSRLGSFGDLKNIDSLKSFMVFLENELSTDQLFWDHNKIVTTKSNLKSEIFKEIALKLGVDISKYQLKLVKIDNLVNHRNSIAHGEELILDIQSAKDYIELIRELIESYRTDLMNSIATQSFLSVPEKL